MIRFKQKGNFQKITKYLVKSEKPVSMDVLKKYGERGVAALSGATPVDTGKTAASWSYSVTNKNGIASISFSNSNIQNGVPIAIILQYGHAARNGYYVQGIDYINPALAPIFNEMASEVWKEVTRV